MQSLQPSSTMVKNGNPAAGSTAAPAMPVYMQATTMPGGYYYPSMAGGYTMPYWQYQTAMMPGAMPTTAGAVAPTAMPGAPQPSSAVGMATVGGAPGNRPATATAPTAAPAAPAVPPISAVTKAVMEAKARMLLDTLPDDEIRRLFIVMFEHFATAEVAKSFKAQHDEITSALEKRRAEEAESEKKEEESLAQHIGIMDLVDDDE